MYINCRRDIIYFSLRNFNWKKELYLYINIDNFERRISLPFPSFSRIVARDADFVSLVEQSQNQNPEGLQSHVTSYVLEASKPAESLLCDLGVKLFCCWMVFWIKLLLASCVCMTLKMHIVDNDVLFCENFRFWCCSSANTICGVRVVVTPIVVTDYHVLVVQLWIFLH